MIVRVKLLADDVWAAEEDKTGFLSVGVDIFLIDYIWGNDQFPCPWFKLVLQNKYKINNIMWEKLTKTEVCEIFDE